VPLATLSLEALVLIAQVLLEKPAVPLGLAWGWVAITALLLVALGLWWAAWRRKLPPPSEPWR
jgi:hypothetical protein